MRGNITTGPLVPNGRAIVRQPVGCYIECVRFAEAPMSRRRRVDEGKAKVLFEGPEPGKGVR
jgi:hypothetical protein